MTTFSLRDTPAPPTSAGSGSLAPVRVHHDLARGGLLDLERLAVLAATLPAASIEHNVGAVPAVLPGGVAPQSSLTPPEIVRSIDTNGCWMVLKNVEQDPEYAALLDACLDALEPQLTASEGRSVLREGFVFLSAPGSVTPTHIDPEHNVLLQVSGTKTMCIGRFPTDADRDLQAERLHSGEHRNLESAAVDVTDYPLGPGDGVYVPVHAPHVVRNGPAPSISLSVTWRTRRTLREGSVLSLNARLRRRGLPTAAPGAGARDHVLQAVERGLRLPDKLRARRT
ncbi:MAG: Cupin superfamily protein [Frankiales bacterium]|nr:Cupin superfamily protein [Frankiales bacterium]